MNRKLLLMSIGMILLLAVVLFAASGAKRGEAIKAEITPFNQQSDAERAACQMLKFDPGTGSIVYYTGYGNGDGVMTYFDPTDPANGGCGVAAAYPFEITSLTFILWDHVDAVWPVTVDVNVYDMATPGDACGGPGALLCSETVSCDFATFAGNWGTVAFSSPCCVNGPFYIGFQYNDAKPSSSYPALVFDASAIAPVPVACDLWDKYLGSPWTEWYSAWTTPPNYPLVVVDGETESVNCGTPWANHKMHFPQLPDEDGWDVHVDYPYFLADDWTCSETGPVTDIHWWGSWLDGAAGTIDQFVIHIYTNVEEDPTDPTSYSHPGDEFHTILAPPGYFIATPLDPTDIAYWEGWYDPVTGLTIYPDHQEYWQYDLILNEPDWFYQEEGTVYWISIECLVEDDGTGAQWGWKNTENHHLDDAVYWDGQGGWVEIFEPGEILSNFWEIQLDPLGNYLGGYGVGSYIDPVIPPGTNGWYMYEQIDEPYWWNIWFYDHPLDYERIKDIRMTFFIEPIDGQAPFWAEITPNWATDLWTLEGMPPTEPRPPMPYDFDYTADPPVPPEDVWIGRGDPLFFDIPVSDEEYKLRIYEYNPEWVSVDVRGENVWVEGTIYHNCRASLDLAFVITSDYAPEPEGACCYPEPTGSGDLLCVVTTLTDCEQNLGGSYQGDGTFCGGSVEACCLPDGSCIMADTYCCTNELGGTPQGAGSTCQGIEACCLNNGDCVMADALCCLNELGGTPQGSGSTCTVPEACCMPNGDCVMLDPLCCIDIGGTPQGAQTSCTAVEACCFDDGSCLDLDPLCCIDMGGTPQGVGTICATTTCEVAPYEPKNWYQEPDLTAEGMDVNATFPVYVLADDFLCTETAPIQEIHVWGSWLNDIYPGGDPPSIEGDPGNVRFHLSLHYDIPAGMMEPWSLPGEMIAEWIFEPGEFKYKEVKLEGPFEGWFNPPGDWLPEGDHHCFEYIFEFDESNWYEQQGTPGAPIVYWLDVQAIMPDGVAPAFFGWKTSVNHWNDDGVWFDGIDEPAPHPWWEMRYPLGHPFETESVDLAFLIGGPCDCYPGEADLEPAGAPVINILDVVYIINYKYKGGPAPVPYGLCSGDANCDCAVNILDVVYIINYKYKFGPPPCTCGNFIANCPGGLR